MPLLLHSDSCGVQGGQGDGHGILGHGVVQHFHLNLHVALRGRSLEGDVHAVFLGGGIGALLDLLPEIVLLPLGDHGDVGFSRLFCPGSENRHAEGYQHDRCKQEQPSSFQ